MCGLKLFDGGVNKRPQPDALFEILQLFRRRLALLMNGDGHDKRRIDGRCGDRLGDDRAGTLSERPGDAAGRFRTKQGDDGAGRRFAVPGQQIVPALVGIDDDEIGQCRSRKRRPLQRCMDAEQAKLADQLFGVAVLAMQDHRLPAGEIGCLSHDTTLSRGKAWRLRPVR